MRFAWRKATRKMCAVSTAIAAAVSPGSARADPPLIFWDGRDAYTLLDRHLIDRQILEQREAQPDRLVPASDRLAAMADVGIGTQQAWTGGTQTRFHGYFLADTYLAASLVEGLEANLNMLVLNPSASDGYRVSSMVVPGFALHARYPLPVVAGSPLRLDVLGTDLGWVTVGRGLLLEQTPLEGLMAGLSWRDLELRYFFAGRGLWDGDDLEVYALSAFGGRAELTLAHWQQGADGGVFGPAAPTATYVTGAFDQPLTKQLRLAAEVAMKARSATAAGASRRAAVLLRADYMNRGPSDFLNRRAEGISLHAGYQLRLYQQGFGPHDEVSPPSWRFNTPEQQDVYVTNPIEYYYLTHDFDMWSHTLLLELRVPFARQAELFANGEQWLRIAIQRAAVTGVVDPSGMRAPGRRLEVFYGAGVRLYPWVGQRYRASLFVTNKQIATGTTVTDPVLERFRPDTALWCITLDGYL
jgi:hypothetical protein